MLMKVWLKMMKKRKEEDKERKIRVFKMAGRERRWQVEVEEEDEKKQEFLVLNFVNSCFWISPLYKFLFFG